MSSSLCYPQRVLFSIILIFTLLISSFAIEDFSSHAEGELTTSNFKIHLKMDYKSKNEFLLQFTMNWGPFQYKENKVFKPKAIYLSWEELQTFSAVNSSRLDTLRNTTIGNTGKTIFSDPEFFVQTVLGGDFEKGKISFACGDIKPGHIAYYKEFEELVIKILISEVDASSYILRPLHFIYPVFGNMLPETRIEIFGSPSITIRSSSFNLYHYRTLDGETFTTENLFELSSDTLLYDVESGEIRVRRTPPLLTSATLFYFMFLAFFISVAAMGFANRKSGAKVPKGFYLWVKVFIFYFLAFIPYHFYLTLLLITVVLAYSLHKSRILLKRAKKKEELKKEEVGAPLQREEEMKKVSAESFMPSQEETETTPPPEGTPFLQPQMMTTDVQTNQISSSNIETHAEILYLGDKLGLKITIFNGLKYPLHSLSVKPFVDTNFYLIDAEQKTIPLIPPGEHSEVLFEIYPKGLMQNTIISGVTSFYDVTTGRYRTIDLTPLQTDIIIPVLYSKPIDPSTFDKKVSQMLQIKEKIENVAFPPQVFNKLILKSLGEINFFKLPSEQGESGTHTSPQESFNLGAPLNLGGERIKTTEEKSEEGFTHKYFAETNFNTSVALETSVLPRDENSSDFHITIWADNQKELTLFYNIILFKIGQSLQSTDVEDYKVLEKSTKVKKKKSKADVQEMMKQIQKSVQEQLRLFGSVMLKSGAKDDILQEIFPFHIKDLFLIEKKSGRLMTHITKRMEEGEEIDRDVVSSMLTAIQDFIADSFKGAEGELSELRYGDSNILIQHSEDAFLVLVTTGEPPSYIRLRMADLLQKVSLSLDIKQWDGDSSKLEPIIPELKIFIDECEKEQKRKEYTKALEELEKAREVAEELQEKNIDSPEGRKYLTIAKTNFKNGEYSECIKNAKLAMKTMKRDKKMKKSIEMGASVDELEKKVEDLLKKIGTKKEEGVEEVRKEPEVEEKEKEDVIVIDE